MKFEWEEIQAQRWRYVSDVTLRMKVYNGWLIKVVYCDDNLNIRNHTVTFVEDINHRWGQE